MTNIKVYDTDNSILEQMAKERDTTIPEIVADLVYYYINTTDWIVKKGDKA